MDRSIALRCATTSGCKGIERTPSHCEVWTKAIGVTVPWAKWAALVRRAGGGGGGWGGWGPEDDLGLLGLGLVGGFGVWAARGGRVVGMLVAWGA